MTVPATRSLQAVLRTALNGEQGALRMIVAEYAAPPHPDLRYVNVLINGQAVTVPNLNAAPPGPAGAVAYLLADNTRMWCLGTVKGA
jgi:hypothetical protein